MPISSHELKHFRNRVFVETGSAGLGWGIQSALNAGFEEIHSVEINPVAYNECKAIFAKEPRVHLTLGDCGVWLDPTLNAIGEPCTIYLDANGWSGETESPFYSAIEALVRHGGKEHLILVDDQNSEKRPREELMRDFIVGDCQMIRSLRRINTDYHFYLIDSHTEDMTTLFPSWVLVADPISNRFPNMVASDFVPIKD